MKCSIFRAVEGGKMWALDECSGRVDRGGSKRKFYTDIFVVPI